MQAPSDATSWGRDTGAETLHPDGDRQPIASPARCLSSRAPTGRPSLGSVWASDADQAAEETIRTVCFLLP
jgi:hypothetical protein